MPWIGAAMPLFDQADSDQIAVPSASGSATSRAGARHVMAKAGTQAALVYQELAAGPLTLHELSEALALPLATICGRVGYLRKVGKVEVVGAKLGKCGIPNTLYRRVQ